MCAQPGAASCLVLGTESGRILILNPTGNARPWADSTATCLPASLNPMTCSTVQSPYDSACLPVCHPA
eukprot:1153437-Pelagomonas_calceolata.AAC.5